MMLVCFALFCLLMGCFVPKVYSNAFEVSFLCVAFLKYLLVCYDAPRVFFMVSRFPFIQLISGYGYGSNQSPILPE